MEWGRLAGLLKEPGAKALLSEAARRPKNAARALKKARALRETVFDLFSTVAYQTHPAEASLDVLNEHLKQAVRHPRVEVDGSRFELRWEDEPSLDRMLHPVARSSMTLLTSERIGRVKVCSADDCDWLFVDTSRNRSRRWCDMSVCGNRSKVRRFRQSLKEP